MAVRVKYSYAALFVALSFVVSILLPSIALAQTYAHGYLRYEVADQSVTITGYEGREEAVTVPTMIGGNPVNTIASGAFADATTVRAVYLPDTVTSVEQGAFGVGQEVVFSGRTDGPAGPMDNGNESPNNESVDVPSGDPSDGNGNTTVQDGDTSEPSQGPSSDNASQAPSSSGNELGIRTDDGSLVTVDDEGNLVLVDADGTERVLDDSRSYVRETQSDGTVSIVNDIGEVVVVADGSKVSFSDAEGRQVVVDAARNTTTLSTEDGSFVYEVAEVGEDAEDSTVQRQATGAEQQTAEQQDEGNPILITVIAIIAAAAVIAAIVLWWRRKR